MVNSIVTPGRNFVLKTDGKNNPKLFIRTSSPLFHLTFSNEQMETTKVSTDGMLLGSKERNAPVSMRRSRANDY